jgi:hypothetical protein
MGSSCGSRCGGKEGTKSIVAGTAGLEDWEDMVCPLAPPVSSSLCHSLNLHFSYKCAGDNQKLVLLLPASPLYSFLFTFLLTVLHALFWNHLTNQLVIPQLFCFCLLLA